MTVRTCPICDKPVLPLAVNRAFPFCSARCRLLDLGKWLDEGYRVPGPPAGDGADEPARDTDHDGEEDAR